MPSPLKGIEALSVHEMDGEFGPFHQYAWRIGICGIKAGFSWQYIYILYQNAHTNILIPPPPHTHTQTPPHTPLTVAGKVKDHPSIADYYKAQSNGKKQITYQHGLSNFSSVQLGDDRVSFKKSLSQDVYKLDTERANLAEAAEENPNRVIKTELQRKHDYEEATELVGNNKITQMEQMMRDKLQQRTKTGPFQLRKTFKYFDRDGSGGIDFDEFQRAMEVSERSERALRKTSIHTRD